MKKSPGSSTSATVFLKWMANSGIVIIGICALIVLANGSELEPITDQHHQDWLQVQAANAALKALNCEHTETRQTQTWKSEWQPSANGEKPIINTYGAMFETRCRDSPPTSPDNTENPENDHDLYSVGVIDAGGATDRFHNGGDSTMTAGTGLYQHQRFQKDQTKDLVYTINVTEAVYLVRLHFYEHWHGVFYNGGRVFGIRINGITEMTDLDVWRVAGPNTPYVVEYEVDATDQIVIELLRQVQNPMIAAIELFSYEEDAGIIEPPEPVLKPIGVEWDAPNKREDGSPLHVDEINGYIVEVCKKDDATTCREIGVDNVLETRLDLSPGNYTTRVKTVDTAGTIGQYSDMIGFGVDE